MNKKFTVTTATEKRKYSVRLVDGTTFVKELVPSTVRTYIRSTPGISCITPLGYKNKFRNQAER